MRVLVIADRLSCRGGADQHLLAVLRRLLVAPEVERLELVVGMDDGTATPPCPVRRVVGVDARDARPVALSVLDLAEVDVVHLHNIVNPWLLERASAWPALATVQDHRVFCPGRGKWTAGGEVCRDPPDALRCAGCFGDKAYGTARFELTMRRAAALARLRAVVVLSRYMKEELVAVGMDKARIDVVPPFVDVASFGAPMEGAHEACVLFVGRLVDAKGVDDAREAWGRSEVDLPLVFAGTGSRRQDLEAGGQGVTGWLSRGDLGGFYRSARALILPSRWQEPFGIVGLEALTLGVPVAAWDSGGISEWHPGRSQGLVSWGDVDALAVALCRLVALPREAVRPPVGFDAADLTRRLVEVYDRVRYERR